MSEDVKNVVENFGKAFEEFKKVNDQILDDKADGKSVAGLEEKLVKIEEDLQGMEDQKDALEKSAEKQAEITEKLEKLETVLSRPDSGYSSKSVDTELKLFDAYCRKGFDKLGAEEQKALTVSNDSTGGYLAPPEYVRELLKTVTEISPIRQLARVRSTSARSVQIPKRASTFSAQWVSESGTRSETTGYTVGLEQLSAHEHYALVDISEQDLEDTVFNLEQEMQSEFATQFAKAEGQAFISGDAVGKPEGLLTNSSVGEAISGNGTALTSDGLLTLVHSIKSEYGNNGRFIFNRNTLAAIRKLKDSAGQYVFQAGMSLQSGVPNTILGYPYVEASDMPDVGAGAFPIIFGDFNRAYLIVDRVALAVLRDQYTQATTGNVRYIARRRVGGQVIQPEAIVKHKISA